MFAREVRITRDARDDLNQLRKQGFTNEEWQELRRVIDRVSRRYNVEQDQSVCRLRFCNKPNDPVWYRLKHACLGVRVAFEVDDTTMTIWAVVRRNDDTYSFIEARMRG